MNSTVKVMLMLAIGTIIFQSAINYMADNVADFENVALPPKELPPGPEKTSRYPLLKIDATSKETWTLVDFESGQTQTANDPYKEQDRLKSIQWDLGFQRTKVIANGGATNPDGSAGLINLGPVDFDSIKTAPSDGYAQDTKAWGKISNPAINDWYNYRTRTHNIESKKNVYVMRTSRGTFVKLKILNYYCGREEVECKTSMCDRTEAACLTIQYAVQTSGSNSFPDPLASPPVKQAAIP